MLDRTPFRKSPLALCLLGLAATVSRADVAVLDASKDTTIFADETGNSLGSGPGVFVGTNGMVSPRRALLSFSLSGIPAGAIIQNVQLTLTLGEVAGDAGTGTGGNDVPRTIEIHHVTRDWGEGTTGSSAPDINTTGHGYAAAPGDATWNSAFSSSVAWNAPGGDFVTMPSATMTLTGTTVGTAYTWLSTPGLVADVQGWLNHAATNFGWELINPNETESRNFYAFYSSEWSDRAGSDPVLAAQYALQEPKLQIVYSIPEPAVAMLCGAGALALFLRRWRAADRA